MDMTFQTLRALLSLGAVIGVMLLTLYGLKRWKILPNTGSQSGPLDIVAQRTLGNRNYLMVVRADQRRFLIGVSPQGMRCLADLGTPEAGEPEPEEVMDLDGDMIIELPRAAAGGISK